MASQYHGVRSPTTEELPHLPTTQLSRPNLQGAFQRLNRCARDKILGFQDEGPRAALTYIVRCQCRHSNRLLLRLQPSTNTLSRLSRLFCISRGAQTVDPGLISYHIIARESTGGNLNLQSFSNNSESFPIPLTNCPLDATPLNSIDNGNQRCQYLQRGSII